MGLLSVRSGGIREHLLRLVGVLLVFSLTIWGFWANSQRQAERLNARMGLGDAARQLSEAERDQVQAFITDLRNRYGIEARVQIAEGDPQPPDTGKAAAKTLFVGISPAQKTAVVILPPLVERALGPEFARQLVDEHFPFHFAPGRKWQKGLLLALDLIQARLAALGATTETPPPPGEKDTAKP